MGSIVALTGFLVKIKRIFRNLKGRTIPIKCFIGGETMIDIKKLGENIRKERKRQLLTIEQLAEKAGITDNFLGKIERGEGTPSLQTIDSIACALNVGIDFLNGNILHNTEHKFITSLIEINGLSEDSKERFIDFISTNIKYFK